MSDAEVYRILEMGVSGTATGKEEEKKNT